MIRFLVGRRTKWIAVAFWLIVLAAISPLAARLSEVQRNDSAAFLPNSAESSQVLRLASEFGGGDVLPAVVVYERGTGITSADRARAAADADRFKIRSVGVDGPMLAKDGKALQTVVTLDARGGWDRIGQEIAAIRRIALTGADGLAVHVSGPAGVVAGLSEAFAGLDGLLLYAAGAVVIVILLLTYRSPVLWLIPVISSVAALQAAQGAIYLLAGPAALTVNATSTGLLLVLVFGVSTDYALLLVARYREELCRHTDRHKAMTAALRRAGPAILASAATIVIGLLCLLAADLNGTRGMGPVAAIGILCGLVAMITLLPALLVICGRWVFWPIKPVYGSAPGEQAGPWARIGRLMAVRPRRIWVAATLVLGVLTGGVFSLQATGLSNAEQFIGKPDAILGEEALARHFPAGAGSPVLIIAQASTATLVRSAMTGVSGLTDVSNPQIRGDNAMIQATLTDPADSDAATDTIRRTRAAVHAVKGAGARVGGPTAINMDVADTTSRDNRIVIPLVLLVVLSILALLLRAIVAPVLLVATVVLSFGSALGISAFIFRGVLGWEHTDPSLPLFAFVFLVALGIDYNIFLMHRIREESMRANTRAGALTGLATTGGVITSAGLVLAGTFAALAVLPVVVSAQIGLAVAVGVLIDTFIVRSVLVTALTLDIGRRIWWPGALARSEPPAAPLSRGAPRAARSDSGR